MYDTTSVFDILASDDNERRIASRTALALAHTRVENQFGSYLRGAVTDSEFDARLAAVRDGFDHHVASAVSESNGGNPDAITASIIDHYRISRRWQPREAANPMPMQDPALQGVQAVQPQLQIDPATGMPVNPAVQQGVQQGVQTFDPMADPYSQQQQTQVPGVLSATNPSEQADDSDKKVACPECGGTGKTPDGKECPKCKGAGKVNNFGGSVLDHVAAVVESDYKYVKKRGDKWVIIQKGTGKVLSEHSSKEEAEAAFRAMEMHMHGAGNETGLGGPEPKMDKRKWTPTNVGNPDPGSTQHPNKVKDPLVPIVMTNRDQEGHDLSEIGEQTTKTEKLPATTEDSGFSTDSKPGPGPKTQVFPKGNQAPPVTRSSGN